MNEIFAIISLLLPTFQVSSALDTVYRPNVTNNTVLSKSCNFPNFGGKAVIIGAGQSNMARMFTNEKGTSKSSLTVDLLINGLKEKSGFTDVKFVSAAYGGSSLSSDFFKDRNNYWVDTTNKSSLKPGPRLKNALEIVEFNRSDLDMVLWNQGEADAALTPQYTNKQEYSANLRYVISEFRKAAGKPNMPFGIISTGRSKASNDSYGFQEIRQAQYDVALSDSNVHIIASTYDLPLVDHIHYNDAGKKILVNNRIIPKLASCLSANNSSPDSRASASESPVKPPYVSSAKVSGTKISLSVVNNASDLVAGNQPSRLFTILDSKGKRLANIKSVTVSGKNDIYLYLDRNLTDKLISGAVLYTAYSGQKTFVSTDGNDPIIGIYNGNYPEGLPLASNGVRLSK